MPLPVRVLRCASYGTIILSLAVSTSAWPEASVVATLDKQVVSAQELEARTAVKLKADQSDYESHARQLKLDYERGVQEYKEKELNSLIDERVLALEAKDHKTTTDALITAIKAPAVTDAEIRSFYDSKKNQIKQSFETISPKIKEYLQKIASDTARRNYLDSLRAKYHATILLEARREAVAAIGPVRGPSNAPVTIVEFSDFQCPFCGRLEPALVSVLAEYPSQVRLFYRNFPLTSMHPDAQKAAEAGLCAEEQGKFWEMHDLMFAEQASLGMNALKEKARRIGMDTTLFNNCLDSGKHRDAIRADLKAGDELGIQGTPATFINGRYISGAVEEGDLKALIEDELRRIRSSSTARR